MMPIKLDIASTRQRLAPVTWNDRLSSEHEGLRSPTVDTCHRVVVVALARQPGSSDPVVVALNPVTRCWRYRFVKRGLDVCASALGLVILAPLLLVLAAAIRLTSQGPALYRWHVIGAGGRPFLGYKLRTMVADADAIKPGLASRNEMQGPTFKIQRDPRITPIGRVLRKYSLDELPQLLSVLKGDMSLVGPRPAGPEEWVAYEAWQRRKLSVVPGMTCTWQTNGRHKVSNFSEWVRMDLAYIDDWSLAIDIRLLARTAAVVVAGTGA